MVFVFPRDEEITGKVVQMFIDEHQKMLPRYKRLRDLYEGRHVILDQPAKDSYKPDNRLVVNFAKYITDTFNGYFIGIPVKVDHEDDKINERADNFIKENDLDDGIAELSKITSIYGH